MLTAAKGAGRPHVALFPSFFALRLSICLQMEDEENDLICPVDLLGDHGRNKSHLRKSFLFLTSRNRSRDEQQDDECVLVGTRTRKQKRR